MTTIKSTHYDNHFLDLPDTDAGETWLVVRQVDATGQSDARMLGVTVKTADLLAALDAVPKDDELVGAKTRAALRAERDTWKARAEKAEAAITRMREWRDFHGSGMTAAAREDFDATLDPKPAVKQIILTADMPGVQINGYDFIEGVLTKLPAADADRLISAGLAKDAS